ncbi:hypothetical protein SCHPADRAFT_929722 [Schizopora paradoxa]|uniref:Protein root UVB sensitive/RUS domain-containing protein n=1 Tax=Schizopora paradoxa TaxID=27342 RepID=A0A0H2RIF3_9AGAM|nr:hypothetical protein SCHPADRAFT_929722 [Schizopora paradoxa]
MARKVKIKHRDLPQPSRLRRRRAPYVTSSEPETEDAQALFLDSASNSGEDAASEESAMVNSGNSRIADDNEGFHWTDDEDHDAAFWAEVELKERKDDPDADTGLENGNSSSSESDDDKLEVEDEDEHHPTTGLSATAASDASDLEAPDDALAIPSEFRAVRDGAKTRPGPGPGTVFFRGIIKVQRDHHKNSKRAWSFANFSDAFLPSGYPNTVTPAFCSSIAGLLSARAVFEGFGVGDENASSNYAMVLKIAQDVTGRLATILFAWRYGTALEPEAKMYRLLADIVNDLAIVLDCLSPALPAEIRVAALCASGCLRAICGVCAGGSKAALSVHFAKAGNVGELNAKDSSQETVVGLLGMLVGSFVMSRITSRTTTWTALIGLLAGHLLMNYLAVRSVALATLNRQRTTILYSIYREAETSTASLQRLPTPLEVSRSERIFARGGTLRHPLTGTDFGAVTVCRTFDDFLRAALKMSSSAKAPNPTEPSLQELFGIMRDKRYVARAQMSERLGSGDCRIWLFFKDGATTKDHLEAWLFSLELARLCSRNETATSSKAPRIAEAMRMSSNTIAGLLPDFLEKLHQAGWDTNSGAIVTQSFHTVNVLVHEDEMSRKAE